MNKFTSRLYLFITAISAVAMGLIIYFFVLQPDISVEAKIIQLKKMIKNRIDSYVLVINGARDLVALNHPYKLEDWEDYFENIDLKDKYPGISSTGYSERISRSEVEDLQNELRNFYNDRNIAIFPLTDEERDLLILKLVYPVPTDIKRTIGLDVVTRSGQYGAIQNAIKTGLPTLSDRTPFALRNTSGFSITEPVYKRDVPIGTEEERSKAFVGVIGSAFTEDFFIDLFKSYPYSDLRVRVYDSDDLNTGGFFYDTHSKETDFKAEGSTEMSILNQKWTILYSRISTNVESN